jgi:hypothetical protein
MLLGVQRVPPVALQRLPSAPLTPRASSSWPVGTCGSLGRAMKHQFNGGLGRLPTAPCSLPCSASLWTLATLKMCPGHCWRRGTWPAFSLGACLRFGSIPQGGQWRECPRQQPQRQQGSLTPPPFLSATPPLPLLLLLLPPPPLLLAQRVPLRALAACQWPPHLQRRCCSFSRPRPPLPLPSKEALALPYPSPSPVGALLCCTVMGACTSLPRPPCLAGVPVLPLVALPVGVLPSVGALGFP